MLIFEDAGGMDLAATLDCGQAFRWQQGPDGWHGIAGGRTVTVHLEGTKLVLDGAEEADRTFWQQYFALDMDYPALLDKFRSGNRRLAQCVDSCPGIRVLRQPFFEVLCTFIISQNNNIPRIRAIVERLCEGCGEPAAGGGYAFPTPELLAEKTEEDLAFLRAGWRAGYLIDAARKVSSGEVSENALRSLSYEDARALLMTIKGVGPKVADCVLLFGLSFWQAFPMDVWMKKAMAQLFPRGIPVCCRGHQGIAQQYIFDYARRNLPKGAAAQKKPAAKRTARQ